MIGAVAGVIAAHATFGHALIASSDNARTTWATAGSEAIGTFVLVLLILLLVRSDRASAVPSAVGAWVAAIVIATSSTGFANPAVTIARALTDTYTGISGSSTIGFIVAQLIAAVGAAAVAMFLYPTPDPART